LYPVYRDTAQEGKVISNQRIFKEFPLGHKVKQWLEGETDDRNICPVLVLRENDDRSVKRGNLFLFRFNPIKDGKNQLSNPLG
jgi:hypothetical protein